MHLNFSNVPSKSRIRLLIYIACSHLWDGVDNLNDNLCNPVFNICLDPMLPADEDTNEGTSWNVLTLYVKVMNQICNQI